VPRHRRIASAVFYGAVLLVLVSVLTGTVTLVLPQPFAAHVSRNSEGYVIVLLLAAWIEFVQPRLPRARAGVLLTLAAAATSFAIGVLLVTGPLPTVVATLNEGFFAVAFLLCWVQAPRPLPWPVWLVPVVAALVPVLLISFDPVVRAAEIIAALVLFPIGLDVVDPGILRPGCRRRLPVVGPWMVALVVLAVGLHVLVRDHPPTDVENVVGFLSRVNEVVIAMFVFHLYFTVLGQAPARSRSGVRTGLVPPDGRSAGTLSWTRPAPRRRTTGG
jgi:hypothetical protein